MKKFKGNREIRRVPVKYKKLTLMPTTWHKANRLMKEGKAILVNDKVLGVYLKLKFKPSGFDTQDMSLGIDMGSMFEGYTAVSKIDNRNFQMDFQMVTYIKGKRVNLIKESMKVRKMNRQSRRNRLRHRKMKKLDPYKMNNTLNYYIQHRINLILRILKLYPISIISIENVSFNCWKSNKGGSFTNIELTKSYIFKFIEDKLNLPIFKCSGFDTKSVRTSLMTKSLKSEDKSERSFNAHCIDSYCIGLLGLQSIDKDLNLFFKSDLFDINKSVRFLIRTNHVIRRSLRILRTNRKDARNVSSPWYFRYSKGGRMKIIDHKSKLKKTRYKESGTKSNHGKIWKYLYQKSKSTLKKHVDPNGGTIWNRKRKCESNGLSKYWDKNKRVYVYFNTIIVIN